MSFVFDKGNRLYKQVGANSSESLDYVPADGEILLIANMGISSSSSPETVGCVAWDADGTPDILISSYSEIVHQSVYRQITGDGTKILRITLTNDLSEPVYMGGFWQGEAQ